MTKWLAIETAPIDGNSFLAALTNGRVVILFGTEAIRDGWRYSWWGSTGNTIIPYEPSHLNIDWSKSNTLRATHWMPLPEPPTD